MQEHRGWSRFAPDGGDLASQRELDALAAQLSLDGPGHRGEVHDARGRRMQRRQTSALRLDLGDLGRAHPAQPGNAVRAGAGFEVRQSRQLILPHRYDQLAAALDGDRMLVAELIDEPGALDAELGFERAGRVVHACVDHA